MLAMVEAFSGFANRFDWFCSARSKLLPEGGGEVDLSSLTNRLADVIDRAKTIDQMTKDGPAIDLWATMYAELAHCAPGMLGAVTSRAEPQVLRLAMVYALLDQSAIIHPEHLLAARALWRYSEDSAKWIFGTSTGDPLSDKILAPNGFSASNA